MWSAIKTLLALALVCVALIFLTYPVPEGIMVWFFVGLFALGGLSGIVLAIIFVVGTLVGSLRPQRRY